MSEVIIREAERESDFGQWFAEMLHDGASVPGLTTEERHLMLSDELGEWIGGARFALRGGVAHLLEVAVAPEHRHQGHAHRLLFAFEEHARTSGAHLAEFWTPDLASEGLLGAFGWRRVVLRRGYLGGRTWLLLEKGLSGER